MAPTANSTRTPESHGPVTRALAAMRTEPEPPRRGFLAGLLALPLLGGGISLIGSPTAVAEPADRLVMRNYLTWLQCERNRVVAELYPDYREPIGIEVSNRAYWWHERREGDAALPPSARATLVLSAVGCDWR